jgi:glycosyltransferase involved in cell wall biosynthesis
VKILIAAGVPQRREGGVAAIANNLGCELSRRGHAVTHLFYEDLLTKAEIGGRFRDFQFAVRVAAHVRKNRKNYSVVNLHAPTGWAYGSLRKLLKSTELPPYVMMLHGLEERRIHVMRREARKGRAWNFSFKNRIWHRAYHLPRFYLSIKTADRSHCYSRDVWNVLQLKYNVDSERVAYIPNGVEERFFLPRSYEPSKRIRLLYPGTWLDQRGIFYLRPALQKLNQSFRDWTFTIAGPGIDAAEVIGFFGEGIAEQIRVVPSVPAGTMPQLYAEHDVLVFPSLMEGLPSVLMEAMASGMPVITTETCGMVDVVENDYNGLLVPPADEKALHSALLRICKCANLRKTLGMAARDTMRRYSWAGAAAKLELVFESAVSGNRKPAPTDGARQAPLH